MLINWLKWSNPSSLQNILFWISCIRRRKMFINWLKWSSPSFSLQNILFWISCVRRSWMLITDWSDQILPHYHWVVGMVEHLSSEQKVTFSVFHLDVRFFLASAWIYIRNLSNGRSVSYMYVLLLLLLLLLL